jgi:hypothetical protein
MPSVFMRSTPFVCPAAALAWVTASAISRIKGAMRAYNCSPVRGRHATRGPVQQREPRRASSSRMVWLKAEGDRPRYSAARAKLARSTTAAKAFSSANSDPHYALLST